MASKAEYHVTTFLGQKLGASSVERLISVLVLLLVLAAIGWGWNHRNKGWIDPEYGLGYALGVVGGSFMLLLLAYPLRKWARPASRAPGSGQGELFAA